MDTKEKCDICNKLYKNKQTLATHKNKFHKDIVKGSPEKENIEIVEEKSDSDSDSDSDIDPETRELILKKLERMIEFQNFIKSCDENIVDILIATSENENNNSIRWICGYEKLKRDDEFETKEDKVKYYKDLIERNRVIIL
jgi:hypothetical protein